MRNNRGLLGRRSFLIGLGAGVTGLAVAVGAHQLQARQKKATSKPEPTDTPVQVRDNFQVTGDAPLKERAAAKGLFFGAASGFGQLSKDEAFATEFARESAVLVAESDMKWKNLRPDPETFNFKRLDWLYDFTQRQKMLFRGHPLIWHKSMPEWFEETVTEKNAEAVLTEHIQRVAGYYAGKVHSWDVVNEAIMPSQGRQDGLRKTPWLKFLGADYIDLAFRVAAETDPKALLVYNENRLDYDTPEMEQRRTGLLKLLERLKSKGTPVQVLGVQGHLFPGELPFKPEVLRKFLAEVAAMGLKIMITEMDATDRNLPGDVVQRDNMVATAYEDYLSAALDEPAVMGVMTWGLSDRYTWIAGFRPRDDGEPVRPLPLDKDLNRKRAWQAIARAFDSAPSRIPPS
ncbi:MAG TPA: endo-1,4-beta-xylanase [Oscillatoriaceae cyanobacterium M33_DOE_052]|uniref:Beta-xylanase n=1 Tax=Planktothricoides sp. SpSt-374 TaxID=2282167 RepID=A0A7C3ZIK5_9CYAN|nr:endo-1,4-beta-xylanase [Oscillatoriaceae cyanobacterium M33_DOE_052]